MTRSEPERHTQSREQRIHADLVKPLRLDVDVEPPHAAQNGECVSNPHLETERGAVPELVVGLESAGGVEVDVIPDEVRGGRTDIQVHHLGRDEMENHGGAQRLYVDITNHFATELDIVRRIYIVELEPDDLI